LTTKDTKDTKDSKGGGVSRGLSPWLFSWCSWCSWWFLLIDACGVGAV